MNVHSANGAAAHRTTARRRAAARIAAVKLQSRPAKQRDEPTSLRGSPRAAGRGPAGESPSSSARRRRGRPLVDDKHRLILDAAVRVFAAKGYHGTAVPDVAAAAAVGTGTLYRYFANKEALVNEAYRDAKQRLKAALLTDLDDPDVTKPSDSKRWFEAVWRRLGEFARAEPEAFRFLEMQDHVEYLDVKSRQVELSVLMPLWMAGRRMYKRTASAAPMDTVMALLWGAFVGLVKASRLGYLTLDDQRLAQAGQACWRMIAPFAERRTSRTKG